MILRRSRFIHQLPVGKDRSLIVHAISQVRLPANGEISALLEYFAEPRRIPQDCEVMMALFPDARADLATWHARRCAEGEFAACGRFGTVDASVGISAHARPPRCEARLLCEGGTLLLDFFHGYGAVQPDRGDHGHVHDVWPGLVGKFESPAGVDENRDEDRHPEIVDE